MKAQTSVETIVILTFLLITFTILLATNLNLSTDLKSSNNQRQLKTSLNEIGIQAKATYQQGEGAKSKAFITLPSNIINVSIENKRVLYYIQTNDYEVPIFKNLDFNITGTLPTNQGNYWIQIESLGGMVNVSY